MDRFCGQWIPASRFEYADQFDGSWIPASQFINTQIAARETEKIFNACQKIHFEFLARKKLKIGEKINF